MKTNTLFAVFLLVLLGTCTVQIRMSNLHLNLRSSTTSLGIRMPSHYVNSFENCSNLQLPLTEQSPMECWPRLIILPSHATSGSKLFQDIWTLFGASMSQYHEPEHNNTNRLYSLNSLNIYGELETASVMTYIQQPIIFKSHISQSKKIPRRQEMKELLHNATGLGRLQGIIRMARNPGDQLIRNTFRWGREYKYCKSNKKIFRSEFDCFFQKSKRFCARFTRGTEYVHSMIYGFHNHFVFASYYLLFLDDCG